MTFPGNLPAAARRHLQAAEELEPGHRRDVAGYLYGIAAECAIKQMITRLALPREVNKKELLFAHFPELRILLRDALQGRRGAALWTVIMHDRFLHNWHVRMRYADAREILDAWVDDWRRQAKDVVNAMEAS